MGEAVCVCFGSHGGQCPLHIIHNGPLPLTLLVCLHRLLQRARQCNWRGKVCARARVCVCVCVCVCVREDQMTRVWLTQFTPLISHIIQQYEEIRKGLQGSTKYPVPASLCPGVPVSRCPSVRTSQLLDHIRPHGRLLHIKRFLAPPQHRRSPRRDQQRLV